LTGELPAGSSHTGSSAEPKTSASGLNPSYIPVDDFWRPISPAMGNDLHARPHTGRHRLDQTRRCAANRDGLSPSRSALAARQIIEAPAPAMHLCWDLAHGLGSRPGRRHPPAEMTALLRDCEVGLRLGCPFGSPRCTAFAHLEQRSRSVDSCLSVRLDVLFARRSVITKIMWSYRMNDLRHKKRFRNHEPEAARAEPLVTIGTGSTWETITDDKARPLGIPSSASGTHYPPKSTSWSRSSRLSGPGPSGDSSTAWGFAGPGVSSGTISLGA